MRILLLVHPATSPSTIALRCVRSAVPKVATSLGPVARPKQHGRTLVLAKTEDPYASEEEGMYRLFGAAQATATVLSTVPFSPFSGFRNNRAIVA